MPGDLALLDELSHTPLKFVALNATPPSIKDAYPSVRCDNEGGAALVVEHLVALGHKRILFALDPGWEGTPDACARLAGFSEAMRRRGLPFGPEDRVVWKVQAPAFREWHAAKPPHTAIFAWHEGLAGGILSAAADAGVSVPEELSVLGFDSTLFCESTKPRLTAVRQPVREMAELAARLLLDLIEGHDISTVTYAFPCTLDVRDSTAPPARR